MTWSVFHGDCLELLRQQPEESIDAIVTDPPYGLGFMGKKWDALPPGRAWAEECLRVLRPGGHLLAFGGTRTHHRLACAVEDAGFEIRDTIAWLYGQGFPKSLDVSKAIDKAAGVEREVVGLRRFADGTSARRTAGSAGVPGSGEAGQAILTAPATDDARTWQGWGTALKPAHEPIVVARKPLSGTVAAHVLEFGTGAINVDGCRIGVGDGGERGGEASAERRYTERGSTNFAPLPGPRGGDALGRWPANLVLDEEAARLLDEQTGKECSRFFYVAKASRAERNAGLEGFEERDASDRHAYVGLPDQLMEREQIRNGARNHHPTVKPVALMRWLVRLVTPPGGTVLDPFAGSGTTGIACALEGFDFLGMEQNAEYVELARARIRHWAPEDAQEVEAPAPTAVPPASAPAPEAPEEVPEEAPAEPPAPTPLDDVSRAERLRAWAEANGHTRKEVA